MKQKQIGKIPYLTLPALNPDEKVKYIGRTACCEIGNEEHILLEVYKNEEGCLEVPEVRYAATKKDWGYYRPDEGIWYRGSIKTGGYFFAPFWDTDAGNEREEANRLYEKGDMDRIREFFDTIKIWNEKAWWNYFKENEGNIKEAERRRENERRGKRLKERGENTPELDERAMAEWADNMLFGRKHYLFYKKKGRRASVCCSACGGVYSGAWKEGMSYESMFERYIENPVRGEYGRCRLCGEYGEYRPQGKADAVGRRKSHAFLAERYLDKGIVLRYMEFGKEWVLEEETDGKGKHGMHGAYEAVEVVEIARAYFLPGKKVQTDYHKHDPYVGEDFWDDGNLYGMKNIAIKEAAVHPASWENLKGTFLQYSALREYVSEKRTVNVIDYLERYINFPQIEMLVKMGMYQIVERMVKGYCGIIWNNTAKRMDAFLWIRKDKVKLLAETKGDTDILKVLQKEKNAGQNWTWQQVKALAEIDAGNRNLNIALRFMGVQKLLNNIKKYAGCEYGTGCCTASERLKSAAGIYFDYLQMRMDLGYDMQNTVYQKPRDLTEAHDRMAAEQNKKEADKRLVEVAEKFPDIKKNYRKLRKHFFYEDDTFLIRPARSAEEIVMEGRLLHHCVGGDSYLMKHNNGETYILMLRFKDMPGTPYITVEIDGMDRIVQWYGEHDKKPDEENMKKWIAGYAEKLKGGTLKTAGGEMMEQVLVAAG